MGRKWLFIIAGFAVLCVVGFFWFQSSFSATQEENIRAELKARLPDMNVQFDDFQISFLGGTGTFTEISGALPDGTTFDVGRGELSASLDDLGDEDDASEGQLPVEAISLTDANLVSKGLGLALSLDHLSFSGLRSGSGAIEVLGRIGGEAASEFAPNGEVEIEITGDYQWISDTGTFIAEGVHFKAEPLLALELSATVTGLTDSNRALLQAWLGDPERGSDPALSEPPRFLHEIRIADLDLLIRDRGGFTALSGAAGLSGAIQPMIAQQLATAASMLPEGAVMRNALEGAVQYMIAPAGFRISLKPEEPVPLSVLMALQAAPEETLQALDATVAYVP